LCNNLEGKISHFGRDGQSTFTDINSTLVLTLPREIGAHVGKDAPYTPLVSELLGKGFSLAKMFNDSFLLS
jgi:hypothetical protein